MSSNLSADVISNLRSLSNISSKYRYYANLLQLFPVVENTNSKHAIYLNANAELAVNPSMISSMDKFNFGAVKTALGVALRHTERRSDICHNDNEAKLFNIAAECVLHFMMVKHFGELQPDTDFIAVLDGYYPMANNNWDKNVETIYEELKANNQQAGSDIESGDAGDSPMSGKAKHSISKALEKSADKENSAIRSEVEKRIKEKAEGKTTSHGKTNVGVSPITADIIQLDPLDFPDNSMFKLEELFFQQYSSNLKTTPVDSMLSQRNLLRREFLGEAMMGRKAFTAPDDSTAEINRFHNSVLFLVDVSGSMNRNSINNGMNVIKTLATKYKVAPVDVITYSSSVKQRFVMEEHTDLKTLTDKNGRSMSIGGGTNIDSVLRELRNELHKYKVIMILTDMQDFPVKDPQKPKHTQLSWLIHDTPADYAQHAPFGGNQIYINDLTKGGKCEITTFTN